MSEGRERETQKDGGIQIGGRVVVGWEGGRLMQDKPVLLDHAFAFIHSSPSGGERYGVHENSRRHPELFESGVHWIFLLFLIAQQVSQW